MGIVVVSPYNCTIIDIRFKQCRQGIRGKELPNFSDDAFVFGDNVADVCSMGFPWKVIIIFIISLFICVSLVSWRISRKSLWIFLYLLASLIWLAPQFISGKLIKISTNRNVRSVILISCITLDMLSNRWLTGSNPACANSKHDQINSHGASNWGLSSDIKVSLTAMKLHLKYN